MRLEENINTLLSEILNGFEVLLDGPHTPHELARLKVLPK